MLNLRVPTASPAPAPTHADKDRVRLAALYALRFESDAPRLRQLLDYLVTAGVRDRQVAGWVVVRSWAGFLSSERCWQS